jgi:hypothetical protein
VIVCNEWKTEKCHECTNIRKLKDSNYDGNCTSRDFQFGTQKISGRLIFVEQRVQKTTLKKKKGGRQKKRRRGRRGGGTRHV